MGVWRQQEGSRTNLQENGVPTQLLTTLYKWASNIWLLCPLTKKTPILYKNVGVGL